METVSWSGPSYREKVTTLVRHLNWLRQLIDLLKLGCLFLKGQCDPWLRIKFIKSHCFYALKKNQWVENLILYLLSFILVVLEGLLWKSKDWWKGFAHIFGSNSQVVYLEFCKVKTFKLVWKGSTKLEERSHSLECMHLFLTSPC